MPELAPDVLFVQESRDPAVAWLGALPGGGEGVLHWEVVPNGRWGSGIWVRSGQLRKLEVPEEFTGRVVATVVEGMEWPEVGVGDVVGISIHAPTRKGSTYIKEVGRILDFVGEMAEGLPLVLAGDFNVAVGMREVGQPIGISRGERLLIERLKGEFGLVPCWQTAHPGVPLARTLRWMRKADSLPYHCDGLFVQEGWGEAIEECEVLEEGEWLGLSDHNPVMAVFGVVGSR
jgi:endonuclease/exonuclease/phosphatase family metal-dependent hydrolase